MNEAITVSLGWTALMKLNKEGGRLSAHLAEALKQFLDTPPADGMQAASTPDATSEDSVSLKLEWKLPDELHAKLKASGADPQQAVPAAVTAYIEKYYTPRLTRTDVPLPRVTLTDDFEVAISTVVLDKTSVLAQSRGVSFGNLVETAINRYMAEPSRRTKFNWAGNHGDVFSDFDNQVPKRGTSIRFKKCPDALTNEVEERRDRKIRAAVRAFVATGG